LEGEEAISLHCGGGPVGGWRVAEQLLDMPEEKRPDGLIVIDDRIATGLTAALATADGDYRPEMVVQTNRQSPLAFALPVVHFEVDVDELARRAVRNLMQRLLNPKLPFKVDWIYPKMRTDASRHVMPTLKGAEQNAAVMKMVS
jgi:DNA-binding LacI/PurR family transcriptional regulator